MPSIPKEEIVSPKVEPSSPLVADIDSPEVVEEEVSSPVDEPPAVVKIEPTPPSQQEEPPLSERDEEIEKKVAFIKLPTPQASKSDTSEVEQSFWEDEDSEEISEEDWGNELIAEFSHGDSAASVTIKSDGPEN